MSVMVVYREKVNVEKHIYENCIQYRIRTGVSKAFDNRYSHPPDDNWVAEVLLNELAEYVNGVTEDTVVFNMVEIDHREEEENEEEQEKGNEDVRES